MGDANDNIVYDSGKGRLSDLWKKEDYWAIWLGFILLLTGMLIYFPMGDAATKAKIVKANATLTQESEKAPFKTIQWYKALDAKKRLKGTSSSIGKTIKKYTTKPKKWSGNPISAFYLSPEEAKVLSAKGEAKYKTAKAKEVALLASAQEAQKMAAAVSFQDKTLNTQAVSKIDAWRTLHAKVGKLKKKAKVKPYNLLPGLALFMAFLACFFGLGMHFMGEKFTAFAKGFAFVFAVAVVSYVASSNATMKHYGIGYAAWAIAFGMIVSNTIGTPKWVMPAVQTEYYIKTGLVLLGAEVLFSKVLSIGIPGIFVAWVVTPIVLISTYWFGQKVLKIESKTMNMTISADMSVCGVSAAIATASACRAKKEELTLAVGLSLIFTAIMMIAMPAIIKATGMPYILGGAWMGGTIDATGAVAAAGAFLSERALYVAATIKMIQNVLIGIIAFCVAIYFVAKEEAASGRKVGLMEIWNRFPKFVIGFIIASVLFSSIYASIGKDLAYVIIDHGAIRGLSKIGRGWFFCLAFVSIGLATNFRELKGYFKGGKPLILYVCGQSLNLVLTLTMAYIMFYLVFPEITAKI
ncbi:MAG: YeiH family protein [Desulfobacterales bacterium]|nr:YeiH family protein [Desulfobacterales bacterium]